MSFDKMMENGAVKKTVERYLFDSLTFTESETKAIEELAPFISGEFTIKAVKKTKIAEIFFAEGADRYYMVKVNFVTLDEKTGMEKKAASLILVQASGLEEALSRFKEEMRGTMADYEIAGINETPIMDVFPADVTTTKEA